MILPVHHTGDGMAIGIPAGLFQCIIQAQGFHPLAFHMHACQRDIRIVFPALEHLIIPVRFIPKAAQDAGQFAFPSAALLLCIQDISPIHFQ